MFTPYRALGLVCTDAAPVLNALGSETFVCVPIDRSFVVYAADTLATRLVTPPLGKSIRYDLCCDCPCAPARRAAVPGTPSCSDRRSRGLHVFITLWAVVVAGPRGTRHPVLCPGWRESVVSTCRCVVAARWRATRSGPSPRVGSWSSFGVVVNRYVHRSDNTCGPVRGSAALAVLSTTACMVLLSWFPLTPRIRSAAGVHMCSRCGTWRCWETFC